ncbi:hypothetical protein AB6A23_22380 [Paenibacillus tarimensis]
MSNFLTTLFLLFLMFLMVGCQISETDTQQNPTESFEKIIVGTEIKTVTKEQLTKVTPKLTYEEVVEILGQGKDIGSGLYILEYEYEGQQFTLNFISYEGLITEDDYKEGLPLL